jgi:hypothetical protein
MWVPKECQGAIIDFGASTHFVSIEPQDIHTADGTKVPDIGRGDVKLELPLGNKHTSITLRNTLYAPQMAFTLVLTNQITAAGFAVHFEGTMCCILSQGPKHRVIAEIPQVEGLYTVLVCQQHRANLAKAKLTIYELHKHLGHVSQQGLLDAMKKGLMTSVDVDLESKPEFCEACTKAKATRQPFPKETEHCTEKYGDTTHTDLWGPA